ncbi:unnamed protein product [Rhizoctonia solani]|uniref:Uncharacterized protein n=2 Tax=Rhizoctonia solani TaxID=456999 RepID=A0A8H2WFU9_9AGAM|nr:unnamed protein product [Rhizoctonia solani]
MSLYSAMDYLIFISLSFFVFGVFTLLGRLAIHLDAVELLVVKPIPLTNTLMGYQSVSFIISAIGAGMKASSTRHTVEVGSKLIITGILLQFVGLAVYLGLLINFVYRMWSTRKDQWNYRPNGFLRSWLGVAAMTGIPLIYRVTAIGLGRDGALSRKEYYYYTSEVMTLWGGVLTIFLMTWPPRVLNGPRLGAQMTELSSVSLGSK